MDPVVPESNSELQARVTEAESMMQNNLNLTEETNPDESTPHRCFNEDQQVSVNISLLFLGLNEDPFP